MTNIQIFPSEHLHQTTGTTKAFPFSPLSEARSWPWSPSRFQCFHLAIHSCRHGEIGEGADLNDRLCFSNRGPLCRSALARNRRDLPCAARHLDLSRPDGL